jgi:uncharacterized protein YgbK (DUF1537 family)
VAVALACAQTRGGKLLYKKIDSTLRGPVAAELLALVKAMPGTRVLFAPANPRVGRLVKNGVLLVHGVPVAETEFGHDPIWPLGESAIRRILGPAALGDITIPEVLNEADLSAAVRAMDASPEPWIAVGSGALAEVMASVILPVKADTLHEIPTVPKSPILMLGGSAHRLNRQQASRLADFQVPVRELAFERPAGAIALVAADLARHGVGVLLLPQPRIEPAVALSALVAAAGQLLRDAGVRRIFCTGGETAFAFCGAMGIRTLLLQTEVEPGLSLAVGEGSIGPMLLAIKPGGFGDTDSWIQAWKQLSDY